MTRRVSRLKGWLKTSLFCRAAWAGTRCAGQVLRGQAVGTGQRKPHAEKGEAGRGKGTHCKHVGHGCDAGRVDAQRLVEMPRVLACRKGRRVRARDAQVCSR